jgi:biopolymer transport protein ExbB
MVVNLAAIALSNLHLFAAWLFQDQSSVGWDPISLWKQMGILAKVVVIILFIMSGWSIGVMIDRWMAFNAARNQSRAFAPAVAGALREGKIDEAIKVAERNKKSHLAKVVTAGLMEFKAHQDSPGEIPGETIEASKRALERTEAIVHAELKRGLGGLATIGSTAPFVGLFGTVWGVMNALIAIGLAGQASIDKVAGPVGGALIMTALGLFAAVPAVWGYNWLLGRNKVLQDAVRNFAGDLHAYLVSGARVAVGPEVAAGTRPATAAPAAAVRK